MPKFFSALDLQKNELRAARIQNLSSAPSTPVEGQVYYDTGTKIEYFWDGSVWSYVKGPAGGDLSGSYPNPVIGTGVITNAKIASNAAIALSKLAVDPLARANHTGTQTASTISDFDTQVRTTRLDQLAAPTATVILNSQRISSLADPLNPQDAATKAYVDAATMGLDVKASVRAATTGDITLSGLQTVDGVTLIAGNRVLVKNQSTAGTNGIYLASASGWTYALDADSNAEVTPGMFTFVEEGTTNADSGWLLTTNAPITLGVTALTFAQFSGAGQVTAGAGLTKTGNSVDVVGTTDRITVFADNIDIATTYVGQASITTVGTIATGTWSGTTIALNKGGTGATTAAAARTNLGAVGKYATFNGGTSTDTVTHNLGSSDVYVSLRQVSDGLLVEASTYVTDANTVTILYDTIPAVNTLRITVIG